MKNITDIIPKSIQFVEKILAVVVLISVVVYILNSFIFFLEANWQSREVFYELISRILLASIGLEFARMLVTHNFLAVLELLAFVVARKMLNPELTSIDILFGIGSFALLMVANRYLVCGFSKKE